MPSSETVSLVLGSGGARGLAHIGVIHYLEENGYRIRSVAGASMGALVGGIWAAGRLTDYADWVQALTRFDVFKLLDFSFSWSGLFKGERIIELLRELVGDRDIESLPVSYTAVATDLDSGKEIWINQGNLFDAIRASIAIPTFFTPHTYLNRRLVDGGLVNPVPIAPTLKDVTDLTVAVNLIGRASAEMEAPAEPEPPSQDRLATYQRRIRRFIDGLYKNEAPTEQAREEELGLFDILNRSFDTMQSTVAKLKLAAYAPDVVVEVPRNACGMLDFFRAEEMIALGRRLAEDALGHRNGLEKLALPRPE
ncbi:MAG: patatin-like phospholipase family protein [Desulfobacterales bacterium]|jgi:NTE family protein|nr:patatin-like phospholipase family protein [Desulfobacteraceae bacterium]MDD3990831.1 patatin-like phospholipase family protein [Desulfobacteraceae bacterium]MDY0311226.1 patatin-like phospholipase family protein [Desulfobacterales bacterium]